MTLPPLLPRISDYPAWHAERRPDAVALTLGATGWTYREVAVAVDALAKAMLAAGVKKGDRVATLQTPRPEYFIAFLAAASVGAIWLGLNPRYRRAELEHVVADAEPSLLITRLEIEDRYYAEDISALRTACPSLSRVIAFAGEPAVGGDIERMEDFLVSGADVSDADLRAARAECGGRDPCVIVYTSGSTGAPKGALLCHDAISASGIEINRAWPVDPYSALNFFPINHVGCLVDVSTPCLVAGGNMVFMEHFDPRESLKLIEREKITLWGSVPSTFHMQLSLDDFASFDLASVQLIVWAGAAMPTELIEKLRDICPRLATNYGLTETTTAVTLVEPTSDLDILAKTVGFPFAQIEVRIAGEGDRVLGVNEPGEIQTRSLFNLLGYWRRPDATAEAFTDDGFLRTGDVAEQRPDGRFRIVGRLREMYKSGGYNVYPREVEETIERHPSVSLAAVVAAPDPLWQEVGIAYVVTDGSSSSEELLSYCRDQLANFKIPKRIYIEKTLPLLPIGKVDKVELRRRAAELV
ncbi:class I adenylate-forming enzyme family protein [Sphingomonas oligophenolica]|uniref:Class I adenylate-forming enzyme family protein n=1 Tax=Sphingomonas oligophenolica TaxID=301154 RepID=A0ABU9YB07_9SPHN